MASFLGNIAMVARLDCQARPQSITNEYLIFIYDCLKLFSIRNNGVAAAFKAAFSLTIELKATMNQPLPPRTATAYWQAMKQTSPALAWVGAALLLLSMLTLALSALDARLFQGVSVWHKPWKFQVSTGLYLLTLALYLSLIPKPEKPSFARRYIIWMSIAAGLFEVLYITWQGAFGLASHYNVSSKFYGYMYTAMGVGAVLLTSTSGVLGYQVLRGSARSFASGLAIRHAIGWGLVVTCVLGIFTGGALGERTRSGGHWVGGTANDALGMAVFNWSRDGGDLRVAHFFALHAMQILPVLCALLLLALPRISQINAKRLVWFMALGFSLFCLFTFRQAVQGLPFLN